MATLPIQDRNIQLTAEDLRQRYDLDGIETVKSEVTEINTIVNNNYGEQLALLDAIQLNLGSTLDGQGDISLWFYSGVPTELNEPFISWTAPEDHIGDIYFDRETGFVYIWDGATWNFSDDADLVQAMSLTNSAVDIDDNERRIFNKTTPAVPFDNGDWWIKEDGSLFLANLSRSSGDIQDDDFVFATSYFNTSQNLDQKEIIKEAFDGIIRLETNFNNDLGELSTIIENNKIYNDGEFESVRSEISQSADEIVLSFTNGTNSVGNVDIGNGFTFNQDGLTIRKTGEEIENKIDNTGLYVNRVTDTITNLLSVNNEGVEAKNVTVRTYFNIGSNSRMEDYNGGTGIFYIGD